MTTHEDTTIAAMPRGAAPMLLGRVVARTRVTPVYQPIVDLASGALASVEALSRPDSGGEPGTIDDYFRRASQSGTIHDLDAECRRSAILGAAGLPGGIPLCIKLELAGVRQLMTDIDRMRCVADSVGRSPGEIVLEVGAHDALDSHLSPMLAAYRDAGFHIAVDRVAGGGTARAILGVVNPDIIKLDRAYSARVETGGADADLAAIVAAATSTGAALIAQGIESGPQADAYAALGFEFGQGYWLGHPVRFGELRARLVVRTAA